MSADIDLNVTKVSKNPIAGKAIQRQAVNR